MKSKICRCCNKRKKAKLFREDKRLISGLSTYCKPCLVEKSALWRKNNRDKYLLSSREAYQRNRSKKLKQRKMAYQKNIDIERAKGRGSRKRYYKENRDLIIHKQSIYEYKRLQKFPHLRVIANLRRRLHHAIVNGCKSKTTVSLLGCNPEQLKQHIESQFKKGMNWKNYGYRGWHVDHIIPLSSFDLTRESEQMKACHYTNLQPMWAEDNIRKSDKI